MSDEEGLKLRLLSLRLGKDGNRQRPSCDRHDILVDMLRNVRKTVNFISELEKKESLLSTIVVNVFELCYSAYKPRSCAKNLAATNKLLERLVILDMKSKPAKKAGQVPTELEAEGKPIEMRDAMIGAISLNECYTIVARNAEHLGKIKELDLIQRHKSVKDSFNGYFRFTSSILLLPLVRDET